MNLSARISNGRMADDTGGGFRGNTADFGMNLDGDDRGGFGAESDVVSSSANKQPHSASGFKRALMRSGRQSNSVIDGINKKDGSMGRNRKPSYFAQGGSRHGLHIGSGAPFTGAANQEGMDTGE